MTKLPKRTQRKRTKGYRMPPKTKYVGRRTKWGNQFTGVSLETSLQLYRSWLRQMVELGRLDLAELCDYDYLACWCRLDRPCHVDIIIELMEEYYE